MKYNNGDTVICLPGFNTEGNWEDEYSGGSGWVAGKIFKVSYTTVYGGRDDVLWPEGGGTGIFSQAVTLYSEEPTYEIY